MSWFEEERGRLPDLDGDGDNVFPGEDTSGEHDESEYVESGRELAVLSK
jgi:hypothetical protein